MSPRKYPPLPHPAVMRHAFIDVCTHYKLTTAEVTQGLIPRNRLSHWLNDFGSRSMQYPSMATMIQLLQDRGVVMDAHGYKTKYREYLRVLDDRGMLLVEQPKLPDHAIRRSKADDERAAEIERKRRSDIKEIRRQHYAMRGI